MIMFFWHVHSYIIRLRDVTFFEKWYDCENDTWHPLAKILELLLHGFSLVVFLYHKESDDSAKASTSARDGHNQD